MEEGAEEKRKWRSKKKTLRRRNCGKGKDVRGKIAGEESEKNLKGKI